MRALAVAWLRLLEALLVLLVLASLVFFALRLVPGDPAALTAMIQDVVSNPLRMATMSQRNLAGAMGFRDSVLAERRRRFYQHMRDCTQRWEGQLKAE